MRTRTLSGLILALLVATTSLSISTNRAEAGYRGWGWGIAAGVATGVIISEMYRPRYPYAYYYGGYPAFTYYDDGYYGAPYYYRPYPVYRPYRYYRPYAYRAYPYWRDRAYYSPYRGYRAARVYRANRAYRYRHR
jgi:hypothetical protein